MALTAAHVHARPMDLITARLICRRRGHDEIFEYVQVPELSAWRGASRRGGFRQTYMTRKIRVTCIRCGKTRIY